MKNEDILKAARDRMSEAVDADRENRENAYDDMEFIAGRQWPEDVKQDRESDGRPVITINRLPQFVRQVTGDIRKLNPAIKVIAGDNEASDDVAEIINGMVRYIEYASDGESIYEGATEHAAMCGMGAFRVLTEYCDDVSFDQDIRLKKISNPFAVYWDPASRMPTREDAGYCFITEMMKKDDFEDAYPNARAESVEYDGTTDGLEDWMGDGGVVVAEYFWKEPKTVTLALLADGTVVEDPDKAMKPYVVRERKVETHTVRWAKVSAHDVLEGPQEIPSKFIPVIAVTGEEIPLGDEIVRTSVIRFAKDPQRLYNYARSASVEFHALQPKAPYIVSAKHVAGYETFWNEANDSNRPYLPYNPDEKSPPPMRLAPPTPSAALLQDVAAAAEDMKATTGIYDAALGERSNETSGVAIRQRQLESDIATSIYTDNLAKSIRHAGRIIVDMIPKIYDTARVVRIIGDDEAEGLVQVNQEVADFTTGQTAKVNPLDVGKYEVRVTVGPNYTTRRQETAESMMQFVQSFPKAGEVAPDLIAKSMDWPDADKLAERFKKTLPPGLLDPEDMPPEQQQAMAQGQQQQAQQMQMAQQAQMAELEKKVAEAEEAKADAARARSDAIRAEAEARKAVAEAEAVQNAAMMARAPLPGVIQG